MMRCIFNLSSGFVFLALAAGVEAQTFSLATAGLRGAVSANPKSQTFEQAEAFVAFNLPWRWDWSCGWHLQMFFDASAGVLHGRSDEAFIGTAGPNLVFRPDRLPFSLELGVSPTLMTRSEFGTMDFGIPFQFTTHASLNWDWGQHFGVGYRYQHMSNASFSNHNPGLNLHGLVVCYRF
jgi:lipid A 3-O-deacylase